MVKRAVNTAILSLIIASAIPAAMAQSALNSTANTGNLTNSSGLGSGGNNYGWSNKTGQNGTPGALSGPAPFIPTASGPYGNSGAPTGAPYAGTYFAPANLALRNQGQATLPATNLDSFVQQSGYNDMIYGDEGTSGPPPYDDFLYINDGISSGGLTTGHPSGAPSAWGYPQ